MTTLRVWAPTPTTVEADVDGVRFPMQSVGGGWYEHVADAVERYGFVLDGEGPFPDPRSLFQPDGVDGLSQPVEHGSFPWTDDGWRGIHLPSAIVYELHVGTFTPEGTFDAVIGRLDHLVDLGVTAVELMPVAQFPGDRGWGYDGVDLYAPHTSYGGPEGMKRLVDACHARGLAVVLDVVYNHLGPAGNYLDHFGPFFTDRYATPWGKAVNLDGHGSDEVRRFFIDNALMWLRDYHVDGLRLDAVHAIIDTSALHFLEELADDVARLALQVGRPLFLVAESDLNDPRIVRPVDGGGYGVDAQWSDDYHHALHALLTGESSGYYADFGTIADVAHALEHVFVYDGRHSEFRGRRHGRAVGDLPHWRFLGYLQTHDQVGNRAVGERSAALTTPDRLKIGAALVLLSPFVPMLFQGEEWGASTPFQYFTDHPDPELGRAVSEGRRREFAAFGWKPEDVPDPQSEQTFLASKLQWDERTEPRHADLLEWHRRLIALRPRLTDEVRVEFDEAARWLVLYRGDVVVAVNLGIRQAVPVAAKGEVVLSSCDGAKLGDDGVVLPPDSVAVMG